MQQKNGAITAKRSNKSKVMVSQSIELVRTEVNMDSWVRRI